MSSHVGQFPFQWETSQTSGKPTAISTVGCEEVYAGELCYLKHLKISQVVSCKLPLLSQVRQASLKGHGSAAHLFRDLSVVESQA